MISSKFEAERIEFLSKVSHDFIAILPNIQYDRNLFKETILNLAEIPNYVDFVFALFHSAPQKAPDWIREVVSFFKEKNFFFSLIQNENIKSEKLILEMITDAYPFYKYQAIQLHTLFSHQRSELVSRWQTLLLKMDASITKEFFYCFFRQPQFSRNDSSFLFSILSTSKFPFLNEILHHLIRSFLLHHHITFFQFNFPINFRD